MGLFSSPKVPNTISDKDMASLQRRQQKGGEPMFSRKAVAQRKASEQQRKNASKS
jgi:hypothetical protein